MGIAFGTAVTIFRDSHVQGYKGTYNQIKLCDIENNQPKCFPVMENRFSQVSTEKFAKFLEILKHIGQVKKFLRLLRWDHHLAIWGLYVMV